VKKTVSLSILTIVLVVLTSILAYLYSQSQSVNSESYKRVNDNLRSLKQLDAEWNVIVLRSKVSSEENYDALSNPQKMILDLKDSIVTLTGKLEDNANILPKVNEFQEAIDTKLNLIEDYKSQHAIFKNSLSFLPVAIEDLQIHIDSEISKQNTARKQLSTLKTLQIPLSNKESVLIEKNVSQLELIRTESGELLSELLKYNLTPDPKVKLHIQELLADLNRAVDEHIEDFDDELITLIAHGSTVLKQRDIEGEILLQLDGIPTAALNDELSHLVSDNFESRLVEHNKSRQYLMIYAALLLLLLVYAAYRLLSAFRELQSANEHLEQRVGKRTADLNDAMNHLQDSQAQLVQSEKMASLGQMVAGITHEINTPLAYVKSGLEITRMRVGEIGELVTATSALNKTLSDESATDEAVHSQLQKISELTSELEETETMKETEGLLNDGIHGMDQISEIITSLKNFSRMDRAKVSALDVNEGLESTLKIANNIVKHKTVLKKYGDVRPVMGSPSSINQVFLNLITNAAQATGENGEIKLTTTQLEDTIKIEVSDNGEGISADVVSKIFDPFFTTKDIGKGTGLGLSIVQRIITEHSGTIAVESVEGVGTCFTIILPNNAIHQG
jgi:signal transduction histidine kinase